MNPMKDVNRNQFKKYIKESKLTGHPVEGDSIAVMQFINESNEMMAQAVYRKPITHTGASGIYSESKVQVTYQVRKSNVDMLKSLVRHPYEFLGGYNLQMIAADGGVVCHQCVKDNFRLILEATAHAGTDEQWEYARVDVLWEGDYYCDHCGKVIKAEYSDD